ncbi:MAG: hypothetical protein U0Q07_09465 [Acidimicrobiales bacterium]
MTNGTTATTTTVRLESRGAQGGTAWLELDYDGLAPPVDLFGDLAMVGWTPPTPAPPPRDAIDWSRPDEATGQRFTVQPYRVTGAKVEPPRGTGPRGQWTPDERRAFLQVLGGVLARHGLSLGGATPAPAPPPPVVAAAAAAPAPVVTTLPPPPAAATLPPAPPAAPPPAATAPAVDADAFYRVVVAVGRGVDGAVVEQAMTGLGLEVTWEQVQRMVARVYRGSTTETPMALPAATAVCPGRQVADLAAAVAATGAIDTPSSLEVHRITGDDMARSLRDEAPPEDWPTDLVRLAVTVDPLRADEVADALGDAGAAPVRRSPAQRVVRRVYRGSTTERVVPAVLLEAGVVADLADAVVRTTARASGLDPADIAVSVPSPAPAPAAVPPSGAPAAPTATALG